MAQLASLLELIRAPGGAHYEHNPVAYPLFCITLTNAARHHRLLKVALTSGTTIKFGDTIALAHGPSGGMLANDCWEEVSCER